MKKKGINQKKIEMQLDETSEANRVVKLDREAQKVLDRQIRLFGRDLQIK